MKRTPKNCIVPTGNDDGEIMMPYGCSSSSIFRKEGVVFSSLSSFEMICRNVNVNERFQKFETK
jgi:hypothetical protein